MWFFKQAQSTPQVSQRETMEKVEPLERKAETPVQKAGLPEQKNIQVGTNSDSVRSNVSPIMPNITPIKSNVAPIIPKTVPVRVNADQSQKTEVMQPYNSAIVQSAKKEADAHTMPAADWFMEVISPLEQRGQQNNEENIENLMDTNGWWKEE